MSFLSALTSSLGLVSFLLLWSVVCALVVYEAEASGVPRLRIARWLPWIFVLNLVGLILYARWRVYNPVSRPHGTRCCPSCLSRIDERAVKCPRCTELVPALKLAKGDAERLADYRPAPAPTSWEAVLVWSIVVLIFSVLAYAWR